MKENDIIVLDNNDKYTLLKEIVEGDNRYFISAGVDENDHIDEKKIIILKVIKEEDGDYVEIVKDKNLIKKLSANIESAFK